MLQPPGPPESFIQESEYDKLNSAFGRMPIVIHLGVFLQKKPIGGHSISLIDDLKERERSKKLPENFPPPRVPDGHEPFLPDTDAKALL